MAHYAFISENNIVTEVIVGKQESNYDLELHYGLNRGCLCKRTSYNTHGGVYYDKKTNLPAEDQSKAFRKNFAGIGYTYDHEKDAFIPPKPFSSWVLNDETCLWEAPVPKPNAENMRYFWNEDTLSWDGFSVIEDPSE